MIVLLDISLRYKVPNQCPLCDFPGHSQTICCCVGGDVFGGDVFDDEKNYQRGRFGQNHSPVQTAFVQKLATRSIWNFEFSFIKKISDSFKSGMAGFLLNIDAKIVALKTETQEKIS